MPEGVDGAMDVGHRRVSDHRPGGDARRGRRGSE
jgi:hypothetical protein